MNRRYAFYPGCTPKSSVPELLISTKACAEKMGMELVELKEASCCGGSHLQGYDDFQSLLLNARNIAYAEKLGLDLMTICNTCQLNLSEAKARIDGDKKLKARVNRSLAKIGLEYRGTSRVRHMLYVILQDFTEEEFKTLRVKPLAGLKVAPFYGCHNIRPSGLHGTENGGEDPYNPDSLHRLIRLIGAQPLDLNHSTECCGFHASIPNPDLAKGLTEELVVESRGQGADLILTPCPLCQFNLELNQKSLTIVERVYAPFAMIAGELLPWVERWFIRKNPGVPTWHFQQLLGLSLGIPPWKLGLFKNMVWSLPVFRKMLKDKLFFMTLLGME